MNIFLKRLLAEAFYYDVGTEKNEFESSVATATEAAKRKFEDSMKQKVVGKRVKIRASRGQPGQPEKDYVIEKVASISVDWYWKQYVVVFKDDKNKEFFLKPGFKVEVFDAVQPGAKPGAQQAPTEPQAKTPQPQAAPAQPGTKPQAAPAGAPADAKAKPPVAEMVGEAIWDSLSEEAQQASNGDVAQAISSYITESANGSTTLFVPVKHLVKAFNPEDIKLELKTTFRSTKMSADIEKVGRYYKMVISSNR